MLHTINTVPIIKEDLAHLEILERAAVLGEKRDVDEEMHTRRVGDLSGTLARLLGLSEYEATLIQLAARLHDIGTLAVPGALLLRPALLTPGERALCQTHTAHGAALLAGTNSDLFQLAQQIAQTHHEHWDGSGYPNGLSGEEIPLAGRIVAVADAFDAMTTDRPYRKAWRASIALAEIECCVRTQFDPEVVAALRCYVFSSSTHYSA